MTTPMRVEQDNLSIADKSCLAPQSNHYRASEKLRQESFLTGQDPLKKFADIHPNGDNLIPLPIYKPHPKPLPSFEPPVSPIKDALTADKTVKVAADDNAKTLPISPILLPDITLDTYVTRPLEPTKVLPKDAKVAPVLAEIVDLDTPAAPKPEPADKQTTAQKDELTVTKEALAKEHEALLKEHDALLKERAEIKQLRSDIASLKALILQPERINERDAAPRPSNPEGRYYIDNEHGGTHIPIDSPQAESFLKRFSSSHHCGGGCGSGCGSGSCRSCSSRSSASDDNHYIISGNGRQRFKDGHS